MTPGSETEELETLCGSARLPESAQNETKSNAEARIVKEEETEKKLAGRTGKKGGRPS